MLDHCNIILIVAVIVHGIAVEIRDVMWDTELFHWNYLDTQGKDEYG